MVKITPRRVIFAIIVIMSVSKDDVRHLATLSQIKISDDQATALCAQLDKIVQYINMLDELDTSSVEPTFQVTGLQNVMRDDVIEPQLPREALLALAPDQLDGQIKVPKVL